MSDFCKRCGYPLVAGTCDNMCDNKDVKSKFLVVDGGMFRRHDMLCDALQCVNEHGGDIYELAIQVRSDMPDLQELIHSITRRQMEAVNLGPDEPLFYVHISDVEKLLEKMELLKSQVADWRQQHETAIEGCSSAKA